jgi:hypothetical protein
MAVELINSAKLNWNGNIDHPSAGLENQSIPFNVDFLNPHLDDLYYHSNLILPNLLTLLPLIAIFIF